MKQLLLTILCFISVSCTYLVDINDTKEDMLCLVCFPGEQDTTFVRLSVATPSSEIPRNVSSDNAGIEIDCGTSYHAKKASWRGQGYFYAVIPRNAGEKVKVSASLDGVGEVNAESSFPPIPEMRVETYEHGVEMMFRITVYNVTSRDSKYGMRISRKERLISDYVLNNGDYVYRKDIDSDEMIDWAFSGKDDVNIFDEMESGCMTCIVNDKEMTIFTGKGAEDGKLCLEIPVWHIDDYITNFYEHGGDSILSVYRYYYKIDLFSISDEMYNYFENKAIADNNSLGKLGLAPMYFRAGNVAGGYGVLGCCSKTSSGWIPNLNPMPDYDNFEDGKRLLHDWLSDFQ